MPDRIMPSVMWARGRQIAKSGKVEIEYVDQPNQVIEATVYGTDAYEVQLGLDPRDDSCSCPYFPDHGYCKHIAAVQSFYEQHRMPIPELFHVSPARRAPKPSSGLALATSLGLKPQAYFHGLTETTVEKLALEVTLSAEAYLNDSYSYSQRLFLKVRISQADGKHFYVVRDIQQFMDQYAAQSEFQTGGRAKFALRHDAFTPAEQQLMALLPQMSPVDQYRKGNYDSNYRRYLLLTPGLLTPLGAILQQLAFVQFIPQTRALYQQVIVAEFKPELGIFTAKVTPAKTGYQVKFTHHFTNYLRHEQLVIVADHLYQMTPAQVSVVTDLYSALDAHATVQFQASELVQLRQLLHYFETIGVVSAPDLPETDTALTPHFGLKRDDNAIDLTLNFMDQENQPVEPNVDQKIQAQTYLTSLGFEAQAPIWRKDFDDSAVLYRFFTEELPNLKSNGIVTLDAGLQALLQKPTPTDMTVSVDDGLLSIQFSMAGIDEADVDAMLAQLDVEKPYVTRTDGGIMLVDDQLKKVSQALKRLRQQNHWHQGKLSLPASQALAVQSALGKDAKFDRKFKQIIHDLAHPEAFKMLHPKPVQAQLRPYQQAGVQWLSMLDHYGFGGILADEMGLGKTLQMISFLNNQSVVNNLVVAPASLLYNWRAEFEKFAPNLKVVVVDGTKAERVAKIAQGADALITSYNSARLDQSAYSKLELGYLVLDEAQFVKNATSKTHQSLRKLQPKNTFALSGTPIENRAEELWALFGLVLPGLLPDKKVFGQLTPDEIALRVKPFILRREKKHVLKDLPKRVESSLTNEMTKAQKTVYLAQLQQMQVKIKGLSGHEFVKNKLAILAGLTRLRQICDTPALYVDDYQGGSGKLEQLLDLLQEAADNGRHVLIFSQFTKMLDQLQAGLQAVGLTNLMLQGNTKPKERLAMVDAFNAGEKPFFLISLKAGGTGLNLTGADMVILVDLWWNPAVEDQAIARAHRIGQKHQVDVYRLITKGTIEEQIAKLQAQKRALVDQVLAGTQDKGSLTNEEIKLILGVQ